MSRKFGAQGGKGGGEWDDGVYDGVRKVYVGQHFTSINYIKFEYDNGGKVEIRDHGKRQLVLKEFVLDYPNEYITSVEGSYDKTNIFGNDVVIKSLIFRTSKGRSSPTFGYTTGTKFVIEDTGRRVVGFHGKAGDNLDAIGAYFGRISLSIYPLKELDIQGGNGGDIWDDGTYDGVKKVHIGQNNFGVTYVKFDYDKNGMVETRDHGKRAQEPTTFVLDYPEEFITSVEGTYNYVRIYNNIIVTSITFKTSKQRASQLVGTVIGKKFVLEDEGGKLIGFHGRAGDALDALGAYFTPKSLSMPPLRSERKGGNGGHAWDDGIYDGVRKVFVGQNNSDISYVKFEYDKGGKLQAYDHGKIRQQPIEFVLDYPNEYITEVEGTFRNVVTSLTFKTSKQKTFPRVGSATGTKFLLEGKGRKLVGFHGRAGDALDSLGVYFAPVLSQAKKLEAHGGNAGVSWDDGPHEGVRKIYIGQGDSSVTFVKFEYDKGAQLVVGDGHGKMSLLGTEEFELDYPDEYITSVEGCYDKVHGFQAEVITMLRFKTNKRTSQPFGIEAGTTFVLMENDCKIVGFHGKGNNELHQIGVHVVPTNLSRLQGKWIKLKQQGCGPGQRSSHAIAMVGEKMYSFGGEFKPNTPIDNKLYVFDLKTQTWSIAPATGDIPTLDLIGLCMVSVGPILYVFGGRNAKRNYSGFYSYNTLTNMWKLLTPVGEGPVARSYHSMTADNNNIYIFGGVSTTTRIKTLDAYNIPEGRWVQLPIHDDSFRARGAPGLAFVKGKIWVVYGCWGDEMDDVHFFDTVERKWVLVETKGDKPSPRSVFATAVVGKHIIIFGGEIEMDPQPHFGPGKFDGDTFALDTETLEWKKLDEWVEGTEEERPGPRGWCAFTSAFIEGREGLLMYGGNTPTNDRVNDIFFFSTIPSA